MTSVNNTIEILKLKLSSALKLKLLKESEDLTLRNKENLYAEEHSLVKCEINFTTEHLQNLKGQIHQVRHQISLVNICSTTENYKAESHIAELNDHKKRIDEMFDNVYNVSELRKRELELNEEKEQNVKRKREKEQAKNEQLLRDANAVEKECESIERECAVLKKRNNAIMLKLRRKLVETENLRKELMKNNLV